MSASLTERAIKPSVELIWLQENRQRSCTSPTNLFGLVITIAQE
jgi:hypothetical protein